MSEALYRKALEIAARDVYAESRDWPPVDEREWTAKLVAIWLMQATAELEEYEHKAEADDIRYAGAN